jgi:hypothetical protein
VQETRHFLKKPIRRRSSLLSGQLLCVEPLDKVGLRLNRRAFAALEAMGLCASSQEAAPPRESLRHLRLSCCAVMTAHLRHVALVRV